MQQSLFRILSRDERQEEGRIKWIKSKCRGCLEYPTGTGKTRTALKCLKSVIDKYPHLRILVVVPTDTLKEQWIPQLDDWGLGLNSEVQIINTVIRRKWKADILVLDECHRYSSETFREVFDKVEYRYVLGLTATFERLDEKHKIMAKYCPVVDSITTEEALLNGWISKFNEYQVLIDVDDIDTYKKYNRDFTEHFEFFNFDFNLAMSMVGPKGFVNRAKYRDEICSASKGEVTEEVRKQVFKSVTYHATAFMRAIQNRKAFINNHPKKIELARKIIAARPNAKIVTFSNNVAMAESIGIGKVYTGKDGKKKGRITIEEFNNCDSGVINSCAKLNEGKN